MSTALVALERQLAPLAPRFGEVLPANLSPDRLIRTVMVSVERLPKLLECERQSLFNAAMSAAILGLEVDGVTGQAFLIPFGNKAQLVVGYKGYNTLAARAGITITGSVVREGDAFDYDLGAGFVTHKPVLGNKGRIIGAWAKAAHSTRPPVVAVLGIDDLMAVKAKSPGAKKSDSPWNDPSIGFPAMCEKTVKRRLARSLPLNIMQLAARMDEAVDEQGKPAWIAKDRGVVIDGEAQELSTYEPTSTPSALDLIGNAPREAATLEETDSERIARLDVELGEAAKSGTERLREAWAAVHGDDKAVLKTALDRRHKRAAAEADKTLEGAAS